MGMNFYTLPLNLPASSLISVYMNIHTIVSFKTSESDYANACPLMASHLLYGL